MTAKRNLTIPATQFQANCLEFLERDCQTGMQITITKHGKPVARLVPTEHASRPLFGSLPVTILGDIVEPLGEPWETER